MDKSISRLFSGLLLAGVIAAGVYALRSGGYLGQQNAIRCVSQYIIEIKTSKGLQQFTIEDLIQNYDPEDGTLQIGGSGVIWENVQMLKQDEGRSLLPWTAAHLGGDRFKVACEYRSRFYSFETDSIDVTPSNELGQLIFSLKDRTFVRHKTD